METVRVVAVVETNRPLFVEENDASSQWIVAGFHDGRRAS